MSTEQIEFDLVYAEAYISGLGVSFNPSDPSYLEYIEDLLTTPRPAVEQSLYSVHEVKAVQHPFAEAWNEDDYRQQAKICYLGRQLIDCAKRSLGQNSDWRHNKERSFDNKTAKFFKASSWHEAHPTHADPGDEPDPDVASPLRLKKWPYGQYVNCLGQSIALSAAAELAGLGYVYASEIRTPDEWLRDLHRTIVEEVEKVAPDFFEADGVIHNGFKYLDKLQHILTGGNDRYDDLFFGADSSLNVDQDDEVREFHHYILREESSSQGDKTSYTQIDPYSLTYSFAYTDEHGLIKAVSGRPEDVVIIDNHAYLKGIERQLHDALKGAKVIFQKNKQCTARRTVADLIGDSIDICAPILTAFLRDSGDSSDDVASESSDIKYKRFLKFRMLDAIEAVRVEAALGESEAQKLIEMKYHRTECSGRAFADFHAKATDAVIALESGNKTAAAVSRKLGDAVPLLVLMQVYQDVLRLVLNLKEWGSVHPAMEIANPEYMIGAMYLNHYATNRKDGRVNVARYLVRYSASQLLWQVAQLDGISTEDPSMEAIGDLVVQLPARQQHPRVALTLQSNKENGHAKKFVGTKCGGPDCNTS